MKTKQLVNETTKPDLKLVYNAKKKVLIRGAGCRKCEVLEQNKLFQGIF